MPPLWPDRSPLAACALSASRINPEIALGPTHRPLPERSEAGLAQ
jgi:hypothetical protein